MRLLFVLILQVVVPLTILSQNKYVGNVLSKGNNQPIESALVGIFASDSTLIGMDYSKTDGSFCIVNNIGQNPTFLKVSCMGYQSQNLSWDQFKEHSIILLSDKTFDLHEIQFSAHRIQEKADTLVYNVAGFSFSADQSIGDVIARMPGLDVRENGQILYQGNPINKFYIEGLDLLNERYNLASQNLDRRKVKHVEVLRNHQPIAMLRDKQFSESAAINLVLEDEAKVVWNGSVDIGTGFSKNDVLYHNRLMGMFFGRNMQNMSIYKNDKTGRNLMDEIRSVSLPEDIPLPCLEKSIVNSLLINNPNIDEDRYIQNRSHLFAVNCLNRFGKESTHRTQLSFLTEERGSSNASTATYQLSDGSVYRVEEINDLNKDNKIIEFSSNYEKNSQNIFLRNKLQGLLAWQEDNLSTQLNGYDYAPNCKMRQSQLPNSLNFKIQLQNGRTFSFVSNNSFNDNPERLFTVGSIVQHLNFRTFSSYSESWVQQKVGKVLLRYGVSLSLYNQTLKSTLIFQQPVSQNQHQFIIKPVVGGSAFYKTEKINIKGDVKLAYWHGCYPDIKLNGNYLLDSHNKIIVGYNLQNIIPELRDFYGGRLLDSYRSASLNVYKYGVNDRHTFTMGYSFEHPVKGMFVSVNIVDILTHTDRIATLSLDKNPDIYLIQWTNADYYDNLSLIDMRLGKSWPAWKSTLSLHSIIQRYKNRQNSQNGEISYHMHSNCIEAFYSARPHFKLAINASAAWYQTRCCSMNTHTIDRLKYQVGITMNFCKNFKVTFDNMLYHQSGQKNTAMFCDFRATYTMPKWEIELCGTNLADNNEYAQEVVNTEYYSTSTYTLRPREFKARFSFFF